MIKFIQPILFILLSQAAGVIGSIFTSSSVIGWYADVNKPSFNPPNWIFGPVWISLFALMGIASFLIWKKRSENSLVKIALAVFFVHLAFNTLWSVIFFGLQSPMWAFFEIILLWLMILSLIIMFYKIDKRAAYLMVPYILWVSFAGVLNFSIWQLN